MWWYYSSGKRPIPILPRYVEETIRGQGNTSAMTLQHEMLQPRRLPQMGWQPCSVMPAGIKLPTFTKFMGKTGPEELVGEFQSQMCFHRPDSRAFPSNLAGLALKWFNRLPEGCITSFEELKNWFIWTYVGRVRQDKDEHSVMTIKQRETQSITSFQERFQTEFNLTLRANQKIVVIAFVEGLRLSKFKESLLKRQSQDLEEVNELAYKYIWIEEADKSADKGRGKRPVDDNRHRSPQPKRQSALDRIRAPDRA
ncbi:hypothetical protein LIER_12856 [Lithospermum erythrorhizon]|uniref:Retrotransposon gag domain-containing protein n=1 Tax=Lithospermum erythrorhizon TaxID=34254 RepID=A0AAV3PUQ9_LITER